MSANSMPTMRTNNIISTNNIGTSINSNNTNNNNNNSNHTTGHNVNQHHHRQHNQNNNNHNNNGNMMARAYPLRMLVHSDAVGAIIGRSGSTIKTITQQTKARIDVHREESPEHLEKVITINGSPDSCSEACFKIIEVVQNEINAKYDGVIDPNRDLTLKILAPSNLIGRLIGKSGSTIKRIMEQTSTRVNISTNSITESTGEHTITVVGKLDYVRQAERLISSKLRTAYLSDMNTSLQTMSQQPYLFNNVLLPYMPSPYAQNSILASMVNPQTGNSSNSMPRTMPITNAHQGQIHNPMYASNTSGYLPLYPNSSVPPTAPGLLGFNPVAPGFEQERETVYLHIPSSMVGAIIGKLGIAIKEMISTSGASIKVATTPTTASDPESNEQQIRDGSSKVDDAEQSNSSPEEPLQAGTADGSSTNASSASPKISRHQGGSSETSQQFSTRKVTIVGYPASQYSAQYMIYRKISIESAKSDISLMVEIYVPSQFVGRIIGKGGLTVKNLQKQTRTTIRLPDDKSSSQSQAAAGSGETCVQITGEFEGSQAAQRHIRNLVRGGLYSRQNRSQNLTRNNESNAAKNNAQLNNHQRGYNENVSTLCNADDKTTNEKEIDKSVDGSPSMSCNNDRQSNQEERKSQVNSSPGYDERNGIDNNNTIINNLNASKQSMKEIKFEDQTGNVKQKDEITRDCLAENGDCKVE